MLEPERWDGEVDGNGNPANAEFYLDCTLQNTQEAINRVTILRKEKVNGK